MGCGMNNDIFPTTILLFLSGFFFRTVFTHPTTCDSSMEVCGWLMLSGMSKVPCGAFMEKMGLFIIICVTPRKMDGSWFIKSCRSLYFFS